MNYSDFHQCCRAAHTSARVGHPEDVAETIVWTLLLPIGQCDVAVLPLSAPEAEIDISTDDHLERLRALLGRDVYSPGKGYVGCVVP